jgi:hypothetical protein
MAFFACTTCSENIAEYTRLEKMRWKMRDEKISLSLGGDKFNPFYPAAPSATELAAKNTALTLSM